MEIEKAILNIDDTIFPHDKYKVFTDNSNTTTPLIHIEKEDEEFFITMDVMTGKIVYINNETKNYDTLNYVFEHFNTWLEQPCSRLPKITNKENALLMWQQLENNNMERTPKVGEEFHFYDDGKIKETRHYVGKVLEVIPYDKAKSIIVQKGMYIDDEFKEFRLIDMPLEQVWKDRKEEDTWLYADTTDYFIKTVINDYDEDFIYFVRTKDGGWFSMNIQNDWQGGRMDIDNVLTENLQMET